MKKYLLAIMMLSSFSAIADIYNGDFELYNSTKNLPAGWVPISTQPYTSKFAGYVTYKRCTGVGRTRRCWDDHALKLARKELVPNYQYLTLNNMRLQPVYPGVVYNYQDETSCTSIMPVVVRYYNFDKGFLRSAIYRSSSTIPDLKWRKLYLSHRIPLDSYYISINRTIAPETVINGDCYIDNVSNKVSL